jgi:hypothetical protein
MSKQYYWYITYVVFKVNIGRGTMVQMRNDSCLRLFVQTEVLKTTVYFTGVVMIILVREKVSKTKLNDKKKL